MGRAVSLVLILLILFGVGFVGLLLISNPVQQVSNKENNTENVIDENNQNIDLSEEGETNNGSEEVGRRVTKNDIVRIIEREVSLSAFTELVRAADVNEILTDYSNLVIIAPNNEALSKLPQGEIDRLLLPENSTSLNDILSNHFLNDKFDLENVYDLVGRNIKSISGQEYQINIDRGQVLVSGKRIVDFEAGKSENLILHISQEVL